MQIWKRGRVVDGTRFENGQGTKSVLVGSNPTASSLCLCSSVAEHPLGKGEVTGSTPVKGSRGQMEDLPSALFSF